MTKPPELKPCPFCGCETVEDWIEITLSRPVKWMYCTECHARGPRVMMQRKKKNKDWMGRAIAAWNTRADLVDPLSDPRVKQETAYNSEAVKALVEAARSLLVAADDDSYAAYFSALDATDAALRAIEEGQ